VELLDAEDSEEITLKAEKIVFKNGWSKLDGKWVYVENGAFVKSKWMKDSKGWCYLGEDGFMVTNAWVPDSVGDCWVGENGYCVTNRWLNDGEGWVYFDYTPGELNVRRGGADVIGRICVIGSELKEDALKELFRIG